MVHANIIMKLKSQVWELPPPPCKKKKIRGRITFSPGPPTPIEPGGTYMLIPHPLNPPYLGKMISKDILVTIGNYKNTPFSWFSREIFPRLRPKNTSLSRENGNAHAAPLCIRVGARAFSPLQSFRVENPVLVFLKYFHLVLLYDE